MPRKLVGSVILTIAVAAPWRSAVASEIDEKQRRIISVERGLKYLAAQQQASGAWKLRGRGESTGVTSLAVLAYLAAGHVPGEGPYGKNLQKAIEWVLAQEKPIDDTKGRETVSFSKKDGYGAMYSHGITTLMLASSAGTLEKVRANRCRTTLRKATRLILVAQHQAKPDRQKGGWRYLHTSRDSDLSVTGWQIAALVAAKNAGIPVPKTNIELALAYVKRCHSSKDSGFTYMPPPSGNRTPNRTGIGVFCLELAGPRKTKQAIAGGRFLLNRPTDAREQWFFCSLYHSSAAAHKLGGRFLSVMNKTHRLLLSRQDRDGGWSGAGRSRQFGSSYTTALAVLALSVDSGHLSIFRR